jgi:hypothetical protein
MTLRLKLPFKQYFHIRWFTSEYNVVSFGEEILYYFLCKHNPNPNPINARVIV